MSDWMDVFDKATNIFQSAAKTVVNVAGSVADLKFGWDSRNLDAKLKNAQLMAAGNDIAIQKIVSDTSVKIAQLQATNALKQAQYGYDGIGSLNADNINQAIANLNARITGQGGGSNIILWLTVAGVGFAALQYFKSR
jgi:phosphoribosylaminoimidazole carboxylase (NCAIR synthetase)